MRLCASWPCLPALFPSAVSIVHEDWCWKNKSVEVEAVEEDVAAVEFRQTGYMLRCSLSHAITLVREADPQPLAQEKARP